jgi:hypothetical protein
MDSQKPFPSVPDKLRTAIEAIMDAAYDAVTCLVDAYDEASTQAAQGQAVETVP